MQTFIKNRFISFMLCAGFLASCEKAQPDTVNTHTGLLKIAVANYPLAYFVERIGGTEVNVLFRASGDIDPAFWQPTDDVILEFQNADLIVMNGASYSKWEEKVSLPVSKVLDTSAAFSNTFIEVKDAVTHTHGRQGEHSHNGVAFTTWIDFNQALQQADAIREALQKLKPAQIELFALNFDLLKQDILGLDSDMNEASQKLGSQPITASHPVYQYWARRYHINLKSVLWEPEEVPTDEQMADLKKLLMEHPSKWFVWEGEPAEKSINKLKTLGMGSVVFDPCGNTPENGNWLTVMRANIDRMQKTADLK